jgi:hypothetical protein
VTLDVLPAQIAFSAGGAAAVGYAVQDEDNPAGSNAFATTRSARGRPSRSRQIRNAQQVLALAYDGRNLELLTGTSARGDSCCSSVNTLRSGAGGGFGPRQRLIGGLAGATVGRLVSLPTGLLAAFATEHGVWVAQTTAKHRFAATRRLTAPSALPESMDATSLPRGKSIVVWTARPSRAAPGPDRVFASTGTGKAAPRGARAVIRLPGGHRIDELAVAPGSRAPTVGWIESWFDAVGAFHSQAVVADLRRGVRPKPLSAPTELAAGLSLAADARGDEAIAWKACTVTGDCSVRAALRSAGGRFSAPLELPAIDASQAPSVTVSSRGQTLLGWVEQGHVLAAQASRRATAFGPVHVVSGTNYAADLTLAFGVGRRALAVWTQGTLIQTLVGAAFTAP